MPKEQQDPLTESSSLRGEHSKNAWRAISGAKSLLSPQLTAFLAVANYKTVHAAAGELHLTQTAVTQRIRALERTLKTSLFVRSRRGMLLTSEGEALLRYCDASLELERRALMKIAGSGIEAEVDLTVSASTSIMRSRVIPKCLALMREYPNLLLHFNVSDQENHHLALRAGECDFAIMHEENLAQEMEFKQLAPEQYVLVASYRWKDRKLVDIIQQERIIDYDPTDRVTYQYLKQYELFGMANHRRYFVNRTDNLAWLVAEGVGYSTLAKEFARPYIENQQLVILNHGKTHDVSAVLAWYHRGEPVRYFAELIRRIN